MTRDIQGRELGRRSYPDESLIQTTRLYCPDPRSSQKPPFLLCLRELAPPYPASPPYPRHSPRPASPRPLHLFHPLPPPSLRAGADLLLQLRECTALGARGRCRSRSATVVPAVSGVGTLSRTGLSLPPAVFAHSPGLGSRHSDPACDAQDPQAPLGISRGGGGHLPLTLSRWRPLPNLGAAFLSAFSLATRRPRRPGVPGSGQKPQGTQMSPYAHAPSSLISPWRAPQGGLQTGQTRRPQEPRARREGGRAQRGHQAG